LQEWALFLFFEKNCKSGHYGFFNLKTQHLLFTFSCDSWWILVQYHRKKKLKNNLFAYALYAG
jgi:hypothetical protein